MVLMKLGSRNVGTFEQVTRSLNLLNAIKIDTDIKLKL